MSPTPTEGISSLEERRSAGIVYLAALTRLSKEYEAALDDAGVRVELDESGGRQQLRINGSVERLNTIFSGFADRVRQLQPPGQPQEIRDLHARVLEVVEAEMGWLDAYTAAVAREGTNGAEFLLTVYMARLPVSGLSDVHGQIEQFLAQQNIPRSQAGFAPSDFRLTILDEDFIRLEGTE